MPVIEIKQDCYTVEAEAVIKKDVKPFGNSSAHVVVPKKYIGRLVWIVVPKKVKQWVKGYTKRYKKKSN